MGILRHLSSGTFGPSGAPVSLKSVGKWFVSRIRSFPAKTAVFSGESAYILFYADDALCYMGKLNHFNDLTLVKITYVGTL